MKKIKTVIILLGLLPTYNAQAQDFEVSTINYSLFAGHRNVDLRLRDIETNQVDRYDAEYNYGGLSFGTLYSGVDVGLSELGVQLQFDFGYGKDKNNDYYSDNYKPGFIYLGGAVLGTFYFGAPDEPVFFLGVGPQISYISFEEIAPLQYGLQGEIGKQFLISDQIFGISFNYEYGFNSPSRAIYDPEYNTIESMNQYSFALKLRYISAF